ncbi:MAG TPA: glycine cleavage system aminomethyltransferase GcvT [Polyangia bacterium]|nr:glycine cleavage system aminomethyltransferase GcvT [Polyangia bacterium]
MTTPSGDEPASPKRTPLYDAHKRLGAKLIDFGGWWMPVSYATGIIDEHRATRSAVGVFDVCHMGEIHFRGPRAGEAVQRLVTNAVGKLTDGAALYTVACWPTGGIVDDLIVYRVSAQHYLIVANAANVAKDYHWFKENVGTWCDVVDASADTGLIAFQGPGAKHALQTLTKVPLGELGRMRFVPERDVASLPCWIARTGYTAEDGFEIFCRASEAPALWDRLLEAARAIGGKPVGLGARDTLRLEGKLSLYGNDLTDETTPLEADLAWVVKFDGADFIGKEALLKQRAAGPKRKLVGFEMTARGIARHGYAIHDAGGAKVGEVTSGGPAPTLEKNIGMGYVPIGLSEPGTQLQIDCRGKMVTAEIVKGPFYKRGK